MNGGKEEIQVMMPMDRYNELVNTDYMDSIIKKYMTVVMSANKPYMMSFDMNKFKEDIRNYAQGEFNTDREVKFK